MARSLDSLSYFNNNGGSGEETFGAYCFIDQQSTNPVGALLAAPVEDWAIVARASDYFRPA
jgi:hypothetical protein